MRFQLSKFVGFISVLCVATMVGLLFTSYLSAQEHSRVPGPQFELPENAKQCIRPTDFMRRNHMHLLGHKRNATMRQGIRTQDASLRACVECHAKQDDAGKSIPVNAQGQFCSSCHEYAAVKLDCFECHRTTPENLPTSSSSNLHPQINSKSSLFANKVSEFENLQLYINEAQ